MRSKLKKWIIRLPNLHRLIRGKLNYFQSGYFDRISLAIDTLLSSGRIEKASILYKRGNLNNFHDGIKIIKRKLVVYGLTPSISLECAKLLKKFNFDNNVTVHLCHALATLGYLSEAQKFYALARPKSDSLVKPIKLNKYKYRVLASYWVDRIGHFAFLDSLIKMQVMGWVEVESLIVTCPPETTVNKVLMDAYSKYLIVEKSSEMVAVLEKSTNHITGQFFGNYWGPSGEVGWWIRVAWAAQLEWSRQNRSPLIDINAGSNYFFEFYGINRDDWFVCLHAREGGFHKDKKDPSQTWRDVDITQYEKAIFEIIQRGGWVIRLGDENMPKAKIAHEKFIDYAHSKFKSDFMDVYLASSCKFFIATNSGMGAIPAIFDKPTLVVNYLPLANEIYAKNGCFIPKLLKQISSDRYLSFDEAMSEPLGTTHSGEVFNHDHIVVDNSPDEIFEAVREMLDRVDGHFIEDESNQILQDDFNRIRSKHGVVCRLPMGKSFIKKYSSLLCSETSRSFKLESLDSYIRKFDLPENNYLNNFNRGITFEEIESYGMALCCYKMAVQFKETKEVLLKIHICETMVMMALNAERDDRHMEFDNFSQSIELDEFKIDPCELVPLSKMKAIKASLAEYEALKNVLAEFNDPNVEPRYSDDPLIYPQSMRTKFIDGLVEGWGPAAHRVSPQLKARFPDIDDEVFWRIVDIALPHTALSIQRLYSIYLAAKYIIEAKIPGDIAECGVFKGGSAIMLAETFAQYGDTSRRIFLFDTFAGWPEPTNNDVDFFGQKFSSLYAEESNQINLTGHTLNSSIFSLNNFFNKTRNTILKGTQYPEEKIIFVRGLVEDTIPHSDVTKLCILRLDTDFYESTKLELEILWPCLSRGGVLLIDDYGQFHGARKAVDDYICHHGIPALLHRDDVTGRSMVKI